MEDNNFVPTTDGLPYGTRNGKLISIKDAIRMEIVEQQRDARRAQKIKTKKARRATKNSRKQNRK